MVSKADLAAIILVVAGSLIGTLLGITNSSIISQLATAPIGVYAAYWAFDIRRALRVPTYRNQALGIGLLPLIFLFSNFYSSSAVSSFQVINAIVMTIPFLIITTNFYWVDQTILAGRRSDPLLRDTYHWTKVRIVFWPIEIFVVIMMFLEYLLASSLIMYFTTGIPGIITTILTITAFVSPLVIGVVWLRTVARRSMDKALSRHYWWFWLYAIFFLLGLVTLFGPLGIFGSTVSSLSGYCLYRSAKSLVPLNHLTLDDPATVEKGT